jgi:hypothetical protein
VRTFQYHLTEMMLLTQADRKALPPLYSQEKKGDQAIAYVKFFDPTGSGTWYAMEFDGTDRFFGYVTGLGDDELGYFSLSELQRSKGRMGLGIERDRSFRPTPLSQIKGLHEDADYNPFGNSLRPQTAADHAYDAKRNAEDAKKEVARQKRADARKDKKWGPRVTYEDAIEDVPSLNRDMGDNDPDAGAPTQAKGKEVMQQVTEAYREDYDDLVLKVVKKSHGALVRNSVIGDRVAMLLPQGDASGPEFRGKVLYSISTLTNQGKLKRGYVMNQAASALVQEAFTMHEANGVTSFKGFLREAREFENDTPVIIKIGNYTSRDGRRIPKGQRGNVTGSQVFGNSTWYEVNFDEYGTVMVKAKDIREEGVKESYLHESEHAVKASVLGLKPIKGKHQRYAFPKSLSYGGRSWEKQTSGGERWSKDSLSGITYNDAYGNILHVLNDKPLKEAFYKITYLDGRKERVIKFQGTADDARKKTAKAREDGKNVVDVETIPAQEYQLAEMGSIFSVLMGLDAESQKDGRPRFAWYAQGRIQSGLQRPVGDSYVVNGTGSYAQWVGGAPAAGGPIPFTGEQSYVDRMNTVQYARTKPVKLAAGRLLTFGRFLGEGDPEIKTIDLTTLRARQTRTNVRLSNISHQLYDSIPLDTIFGACTDNGFQPVQEDGEPWSGFIAGREGHTTIDLRIAGAGPRVTRKLSLQWHKHDTGRFEITAYVS